ncbi:MAG: Bacterial domain [Chryseobacterium sp.]|jgi:uncharacterized protein YgiM (DUF1202 family)|nr:Bacterial domain [Chryseobacterium sp.]
MLKNAIVLDPYIIVNVYEHMDTESAIQNEIDAGNAVIVTESFFGSTGWWKICFEGNSGWVKKALLSKIQKDKPNNSQIEKYNQQDNSSQEDEDVGFSPFLGKTLSNVNLRSSPSTKSNVIRQIQAGFPIYIISEKTIDEFYKAIDLETGKIGWISKKLIRWYQSVDAKSSGGFQSIGKTTNYNSEVKIINKSSSKITLVVGNETFYILPNSTATKSIKPGNNYYITTAPGVVPTSGYHNFGSYEGYEWEFWIETKYR